MQPKRGLLTAFEVIVADAYPSISPVVISQQGRVEALGYNKLQTLRDVPS